MIDDRPEFTRPELFPAGTTCALWRHRRRRWPASRSTRDTYVVIVTRGHNHDADALAACIHRAGGLHRHDRQSTQSGDDAEGVRRVRARRPSAEFDRVYAPIGLDIGSVTVPEIAASIVAQLIAVRRKGTSPRDSRKVGTP